MRFVATLVLSVALAACATTPPAATTVPAAATAPPVTRSSPGRIFADAGRPNAPTLDAITRALGAPDIRRQDGAGTTLTYRLNTCALLLIFTADTRNVMRLAEADPSARQAGSAAPSLDTCVAEAQARPRS